MMNVRSRSVGRGMEEVGYRWRWGIGRNSERKREETWVNVGQGMSGRDMSGR